MPIAFTRRRWTMLSSSSAKGAVMSISSEQASRIEARLDQLVADVSTVKGDVSTLKTDVSSVKTDVSILKTDVSTLKAEVVDLRVHMGVLHEAAIDQIKLVAEGQEGLREQVGREFAAMRTAFEDRIRPIEDTVQAHSAELKRRP